MTHLVSALRWYMLDQLGLVGLGMHSALGVVEVGVGPYPPITNRHSFLLLVIDIIPCPSFFIGLVDDELLYSISLHLSLNVSIINRSIIVVTVIQFPPNMYTLLPIVQHEYNIIAARRQTERNNEIIFIIAQVTV